MRATDHQLVTGQANDIDKLLDYYLSSTSDVSDEQAAASWQRLADAAHEKLGTGWTQRDVEKHFTPKTPDLRQYNPHDVEDCHACSETDAVCPFHVGVEFGIGALRRGVDALVDYPEQLEETLAFADGQPTTHPEVRSEVFHTHQQIEDWAEEIVVETTGSEPTGSSFGGDCHGLYVGPDRVLVRTGERVEAVISPGSVQFRRG